MNGNELANVLKYPGGEWRAGELLPEEWWKKDFPYGEAERMGYRMSPEEIRGRKRREKSISEQMADILRSKDFMMLNAADRMKVMETVRKIQEAEAKGKREREKHEAEMLATGKETQLRERVQAILQSDRVPAQKVTALTMAGVPLSDARDMVWGKRAPGEEAGRGEAAPRAKVAPTGEELVEGLRPERRGMRVFEGEEGLVTASVVAPSTPEERAEYRLYDEIAAKERERRDKVEEARKLRNEAIYERRRENIAEATRLEREAEEKEKEARRLRIEKIDIEGVRLKAEKREEEEKRLERERGIYEARREAVRPPTRIEELAVETAETAAKAAEEARVEAKFAPGELHRKYLYALDEATKKKNEGIEERRRGNIANALVAEAEEARLEAEARRLMIAEVDARGVEMTAEKKAEEKERLEEDKKKWEDKRNEIRGLVDAEAAKEEAKARERQERIDYIDSLGREMKTGKEEKEKAKLEKLQEQWETTRKAIKEATEKDEEREREEEKARRERIKEVREIGEALAKKRYQAKLDKAKYEAEQRKIARLERIEDREFAQTILDKTFNWLTVFRNLGFDHEDFVEIIPEFLRMLGMNRAQEEAIAKGLGLMFEKSEEAEKEKVEQFEKYLGEQAGAIDKRVKIEGMTPELENQIEMMALLYLMLEEKKLSEGKGLDKWSSTLKTGGWYFGPAENPFKTKVARDLFIKEMPKAIDRVRTGDLMSAAVDLLGEQAGKMVKEIGKPPKAGVEIELPKGLITACTTFDDSVKNECYETYRTLFNTKGVMTEPGVGDRKTATQFVIGMLEKEWEELYEDPFKKEELPVNMNDSDYVKAVLQTTTFSRKQKAWLFWKRFHSPIYWQGMRNQAGMLGNLVVVPEETGKEETGLWGWVKGMLEEKPETHWFFKPGEKALGKIGEWWKGKEPEKTKPTGNIRDDVNAFLAEHGMDQTDPAIRDFLKGLGWKDDQISALGIE